MPSFRKSVSITVGDRALEDLHARAATQRGRGIAAETRDWLLVKSVLQPGERKRARVAVRFPHERNAAGFAFVTDRRVIFEARERVTAVALAYIIFAGRPAEPSLGDFAITARTPGGPAGGEYTTTMRIRDAEAFHDFFPTLLDAAQAAGALPDVDTSWDGDGARGRVSGGVETGEPLASEVVERALATFMEDDEQTVFSAELVCDGGRVTVLVTQWRLVVIESQLIWATPLERTKVGDLGGRGLEVSLLAETVSDSQLVGRGVGSVDPGERRLTLRADDDPAAASRFRAYLRAGGAGGLDG